MPRSVAIEGRGTYGDYDVTEINGGVDITSGNAGVRLNRISGKTKVDLQRSDIIRAIDVKGDVYLEGRGSDIELENIAGQVSINGSYSGALQFKNLAKPLHLESRNTDLTVAQVPGSPRSVDDDVAEPRAPEEARTVGKRVLPLLGRKGVARAQGDRTHRGRDGRAVPHADVVAGRVSSTPRRTRWR